MTDSILPRRKRGKPTAKAAEKFESDVRRFIRLLIEINETVGFKMSVRGWCYILENRGIINKSDFDYAQGLINDRRKTGDLPNYFFAGDDGRAFESFENYIDDSTPGEEAERIIGRIKYAHHQYYPKSFWEDQTYYIQMLVEKVDLRELFNPICKKYKIPVATAKGWGSIGQRKNIAFSFKEHEEAGRIPVLLYCGDHDPKGLQISDFIKSNLDDIYGATEWNTENLIIDRFGLNYDFIIENNLMWIDNLETGQTDKSKSNDLADPKHRDHGQTYVQDYIRQFGSRKCEANALVVAPDKGRELCEAAINNYIPASAVIEHRDYTLAEREKVRLRVLELIEEMKH